MQLGLLSQKHNVKPFGFSGANVRGKQILRQKPECIIFQVDTNDALNLSPNEILDKIWELKTKITEINKDCKVIISTLIYGFDNRKVGNTVSELTNMLINLNVPLKKNTNISWKHFGRTA